MVTAIRPPAVSMYLTGTLRSERPIVAEIRKCHRQFGIAAFQKAQTGSMSVPSSPSFSSRFHLPFLFLPAEADGAVRHPRLAGLRRRRPETSIRRSPRPHIAPGVRPQEAPRCVALVRFVRARPETDVSE